MKRFSFFSLLFFAASICAAVLGIRLSLVNMQASPVLVEPPQAAMEQAERLMEAICGGDYASAEAMLLGNPALGADREPADTVGSLIWNAFNSSRSYEFQGQCYATDSGIAWDVSLTYLDMDSVTANLRQRSQALLEQRMAMAEEVSDIYDENNNYREDFVMAVLYDAAVSALEEDKKMTTVNITLNLVYQNGQWWVVADSALLDAISGGILH